MYHRNVDTVLRGVAEGSYRANTEEGKRIMDSISTSLDHAPSRTTTSLCTISRGEFSRKMASISEEVRVTLNSNATQEFMNDLQKDGQDLRTIEKMMVDHPEQGQASAEKFTHEKVEAYFKKFHEEENTSRQKIEKVDVKNSESIQSQENSQESKEIYEKEKHHLQSNAHRQGLDQQSIVDKRPAENIDKISCRRQ